MTPHLTDVALRVAHDLGKYATLHARWLPEDASPRARWDAARSDLLQTLRGPDGMQDAATLARAFSRLLCDAGLAADAPLLVALSNLEGAVAMLRDAPSDPDDPRTVEAVHRGMEAARAARAAARALAHGASR